MAGSRSLNENAGWRFFTPPVLLLAWFCFLAWRLCSLHLGERALRNQTDLRKPIYAPRGIIYDRGGAPVAVNRPCYKVFVDPFAPVKEGQFKAATARRIADVTGKPYEDVLREIEGRGKAIRYVTRTNEVGEVYMKPITNRYIVVGLTSDESVVDIKTNKTLYCCAGFDSETIRVYPLGRTFSHVVGFISGSDAVGRNGGVEQYAEKSLHGTPGFYVGVKDRDGGEIRERRKLTVPAIDGASVHLTIDRNIQHFVHEALAAGITNYCATGGKVIVQKVDTGEILAMVSLPDFDPCAPGSAKDVGRRNRAIGEVYDPGSTMKGVTISAALNEGIVAPDTVFDIGQGSWNYGGRILRDHPRGHLTVSQIIQKSSNIGAAKVGLMLGNKRLESYIKAFGFTRRLGIDLPGEERGILPPSSTWEPVKPTRVAMGQGISVTPLQMLNAYTTIANGGQCMRPYVISRIEAADGSVLYRNEPKVLARPIRAETSRKMREILKSVTNYAADRVDHGTGWRARVEGYSVAGKTGTAQMFINGAYSEKDYWSSFVGFVPAEDPVFSMIVILDAPRGELTAEGSRRAHDGGGTAAPLFSKIASFVAQYLEIPIEE